MDREKVIKGLECCAVGAECDHCPYSRLNDGGYQGCYQMHQDALALLKAQEPIEARLHLCDNCKNTYPECDAKHDDIMFGCGIGNDNVIGCAAYINRWKSQEPRVMTLEEMEDWDGAVFFEAFETDMYYALIENVELTAGMDGEYVLVNVVPGEHHRRIWSGEHYGKIWRCWTSRPTDEQREATPWE